MTVPDFQSIMLPVLKLLDDGQAHRMADLTDQIADQFHLTDSERAEPLPSGQPRLANRVAWARTYMGRAGLLEPVARGSVRITERGRALLAEQPSRIDSGVLNRYPEFVSFRQRSGPAEAAIDQGAPSAETLEELFERFSAESENQVYVQVRRQRAAQLRDLLARPDDLDAESFNREVWRHTTAVVLDGEPIPSLVALTKGPEQRTWADIGQAIQGGRLELHGNAVWAPGSTVYRPGSAITDTERTRDIRRALTILNDDTRSFIERAHAIAEVSGFGLGTATGLLLLMHPSDFALYNKQSIAALNRLGHDTRTLEGFEQAAGQLRQELGAEDFLELDAFLYWFVNRQPATTVEEYPGSSMQNPSVPHGEDGEEGLPGAQRAVWLFQANPNFYNLAQELQQMKVGHEDDWSVTRYKDRIEPGDEVLLWQGGKEAGIYATAEVTTPLFHRTEIGDWMVKRAGADAKPDMGVRYRLTRILNPPIPKSALQQHPILKDLMVLRAPTGTNFAVTQQEWVAIQELIGEPVAPPPDYVEPTFEQIRAAILARGLRFSERTLRRYHLSLKTRGFVILSGISGGGKTQLARAYAEGIGADSLVVAVAPNWNTNEDLLGFFNPVYKLYVDTSFSHFLRRAALEYQLAVEAGRTPRPFHVILDEMNLARVEHYFAKFLSAMELRAAGRAEVELAPGELIELPVNLAFIGTVNVDETTHGFANKVYDRAQLVEVEVPRALIAEHLAGQPYEEMLLEFWDHLHDVAPFAFRVLDEIDAYVAQAATLGIPWQEAVDDELLQKLLPKLGGALDKVGPTLDWLAARTRDEFPITYAKSLAMAARCHAYGFTSYF